MLKQVDDVGRVLIPKAIREEAGLKAGDTVEITVKEVNDKCIITLETESKSAKEERRAKNLLRTKGYYL